MIESKQFNVTFSDEDDYAVIFDEGGESFDVDFGADVEREYHGATEVVPSTVYQTLPTANKSMADNIIIDPIPNCYGLITYNGSVITVS